MFIKNKYFKIYFDLCNSRAKLNRSGYLEKHHIIPTSFGGTNDVTNIVKLTAREHFIAHSLLIKITSGENKRKMCYALSFFTTNNSKHERKLSSFQFAKSREAFVLARTGTKASENCKLAVSKAKKGIARTQEEKIKMGAKLKVKHKFYHLSAENHYEEHNDFYRYCEIEKLGRSTIQKKMKNDEGVITAGKHKGRVFSFNDMGKDALIQLRNDLLDKTNKARSKAVAKTWNQRTPILHNTMKIDSELISDEFNIIDINTPTSKNEIFDLISKKREKNKNYLLFFSDELQKTPDLILSKIDNQQHKNKKIGARTCSVEEISNKEARDFLSKNHLQGAGNNGKIRVALKKDGIILSVMTFSAARYNKHVQWELLRFASLANVTVSGGASKLMSYFRKHYSGSIVSYADLRYSTGNVYYSLNFKLKNVSVPCYWYVKNGERFHRSVFQKHKLPQKLEKFDNNKTEIVNMMENDYHRVFDAGCLVFILK